MSNKTDAEIMQVLHVWATCPGLTPHHLEMISRLTEALSIRREFYEQYVLYFFDHHEILMLEAVGLARFHGMLRTWPDAEAA